LKGTPGAVTNNASLAHDWEKGIFTAKKYRFGAGVKWDGILGATVHDVQSWLARRRNLSAHEWLLRKVLDDAADETLRNGQGRAKYYQRSLDEETGYDSAD
jgi:hypothetical protein